MMVQHKLGLSITTHLLNARSFEALLLQEGVGRLPPSSLGHKAIIPLKLRARSNSGLFPYLSPIVLTRRATSSYKLRSSRGLEAESGARYPRAI
jgi:hypothetical protein